jgi:hypothetical protein
MDFFDPAQRKKHNKLLVIGYVLVAILIGLATYILFLVGGEGYGVNRKTGDVIQNGLVLVAAKPADATISLDGVEQSKGEARLNIPTGEHKITISLEGYQTWEKTVTVDPGGIERIIYPVLFPQDINAAQQVKFEHKPIMTTQSPDQKWLVTQLADGALAVVDLSKPTSATIITLPAGVVTPTQSGGGSTFTAQEWAADNKHVLLSHKLDSGGVEYIALDRESPEKSQNINQLFRDRSITSVSLHDKKHDKFYLYDSAELVLLEANSKEVKQVASNVTHYKSYKDDTLLYVTKPASGSDKADLHFSVRGKTTLLRKLPVASNYLLDIAEFDRKLFVVAGSAADGRTYIYKDIMSTYDDGFKSAAPHRVLVVDNPSDVSFSTTAQFISVQSSSKIALYDTESEDQIGYDRPSNWTGTNVAKWMDGHRLIHVDETGIVRVMDFDRTNAKELTKLTTGADVLFDSNFEALFGFTKDTDTTYSLVKVGLRIN